MTALWTLLWVLFGTFAAIAYASVATVLMVVVRRRVMEVTCIADVKKPLGNYSPHLYCPGSTSHWGGVVWAGLLWPVALVPLLILRHLYREQADQKRIERLERELGMAR